MPLLEPGHEKTCIMAYGNNNAFVNNKGAQQPVHPRSLIGAFVIH